MTSAERVAHEKLLRAAHNVIGEEITDRLPQANDDAESAYHEEALIAAAREYVRATKERGLTAPFERGV